MVHDNPISLTALVLRYCAWASHLGEILDDRLAADYDVEMEFTSAEAAQACQRARAFLDRIQHYLLTKDFTADELSFI